jgi:dissimilatory sulfite reductase (desulfoviridin) alpha/beta subunit
VCRKDLCGSVRAVYVLEKLPDVSRPGLVEVESYRMVSKPTLAVSQTHVSQLCKHGAHGWSGHRVVTQHGTCAGTGHTDVSKRGRS